MKVTSLLGVAVLLLIAACERLETAENVYQDAKEAISAGAMERGWIPAFLPPSAKEIIEKHNLDTNEVWLRFLMDPSELGSIENSCQRTDGTKVTFPRRGASDWWPEALAEKGLDSQRQADGYAHYSCENGSIAVERGGYKVFYWHLG